MQAEDGYSIDEQTAKIQAYCTAHGWQLSTVYSDPGYSGSTLDRPGLQRLIDDLRAGDTVIVYRLDRLSRSQRDTLHFIEEICKPQGVAFVSINENFDTGTPLGMAMVGILSVFAQLERENIKARMMLGKEGRHKEGHWMSSRPPFGYQYIQRGSSDRGRLEEVPEDAALIIELFRRYTAGESARAIGIDIYNRTGIQCFRTSDFLHDALRNPTYIGLVPWQGKTAQGAHTAIIDRETWESTQARLKRNTGRNMGKTKHLLTGLCYCGLCGSRMRYSTNTIKGVTRTYYICVRHNGRDYGPHCPQPSIRAPLLEQLVIDYCRAHVIVERPEEATVPPVDYSAEIAQIKRQIDRALRLYTLDSIDEDALQTLLEDLQARKQALEDKQLATQADTGAQDAAQDAFRAFTAESPIADHAALNRLLSLFIDRITIAGTDVDIRFSIPVSDA